MTLVERHIIGPDHKFFKECDVLAFVSKNLYNQALYRVRQHYFETGDYLNYNAIQKQLQEEKQIDYVSLPAKVSQQTLKLLDQNFRSFFAANKAYKKDPSKYKAPPKMPGYKHKTDGRFIVTYTNQAISRVLLRNGIVKLSKANISFFTKQKDIQQVRIVPRYGHYVIEVVYDKQEKPQRSNSRVAAIDIGLNNLAAITFNFEKNPILVNGRPLKSINQFFNKKKAILMSHIGDKGTSKRIQKLSLKRNNKMNDYLHKCSRYVVDQLANQDVSTLVIGWNDGIKQSINIGKKNNQNFVTIPFYKFIQQLQYKAQLEGIKVIVREESYTSKCSFLDSEPIMKQETYLGRRVKRGLFRASTGRLINSDVNGSYNIMSKEVPNTFVDGIEGVVVHPVRITPHQQRA